jgi:hypothetical protein
MENVIDFSNKEVVQAPTQQEQPIETPQIVTPEVSNVEVKADIPTPTVETPTLEPKVETPTYNFDEEFTKRSNGKFKNVDEALNLTQEYENKLKEIESKPKYANELVEKLNDYVSKGGDYKTFLKFQDLDVDAMDDLEVAIEYYKTVEGSGATEEQIEAFLVDQYKQGVDAEEFGFTDYQVDAGAFKLKNDAKNFRAKIAELKAKSLEVAPKQTGLSQEEQQLVEAKTQLFKEIQEASNLYKGFTVSTDDPEAKATVNIEADEQTTGRIKSIVENPESNIWQLFATKEGQFDKGKFIKAVHYLQNPEKFEKMIASNSFAQGVQSVLAQTKNATLPSNTVQTAQEPSPSDFSANREALMSQLGLRF